MLLLCCAATCANLLVVCPLCCLLVATPHPPTTVHIDSSAIIDSVISSYQRTLLDLVFLGDAASRDKVRGCHIQDVLCLDRHHGRVAVFFQAPARPSMKPSTCCGMSCVTGVCVGCTMAWRE